MNITIITYLYPGDISQSRRDVSFAIHDFTKEWVKRGHNVHVIRLWNYYPKLLNKMEIAKKANKYNFVESFYLDGVKISRVPIFKIPGFPITSIKKTKTISKIIEQIKKKYRPDLIVSHMINDSLEISHKISEVMNIPLILTIHGSDLDKMSNKKLKRYKKIEPSISKIGFRSEKLLHRYDKEICPVNDYNRHFVVHSGVKQNIIKMPNVDLFEKKKKNKQILVVGHLVKQKKIDLVLKAFSEIRAKKYTLKIIGEGKEKKSLMDLSKKLNINSKVIFEGQIPKDDVIKEMEKSEIFILTSKNETLGLVYLEAMSQGCLTIGSEGEGIDGIIKHRENGFLCDPTDYESVVMTLENVINLDSEKKQQTIIKTIETINNYTTEKVATDYLNVIKNAVGDH